MRALRFAAIALTVWANPVAADITRYDLGQRLRLMDRAWETASAENRAKAIPALKKAVPYFFAGKPADAAATLDEARFILRGVAKPSDAQRWATALRIVPATRFLDPADGPLRIRIVASYETRIGMPHDVRVQFSVNLGGRKHLLANESIASFPAAFEIAVDRIPTGDHTLTAVTSIGGQPLAEAAFGLSLSSKLKSRVDALRTAVLPVSKTVETQTARSLRTTLGSLLGGFDLETDFPADRLLREAEELTQAAAANRPYYGPKRNGEFWISVPASGGEVAARLFVPDGLEFGKPVPLVIAMHGAGASENMFFDAYGDGGTVKMCRDRRWLMVATRSGGLLGKGPPVGEVVEQLSRLYPIDPKRIFLVGHSMGAVQAIAAVQTYPAKFAAAAALGGGGVVRNAPALKGLPVFIGCGTEDFALAAAKSLTQSLEQAGARTTYKAYPDVEHIVIVQAARKDLFDFFEQASNSFARPIGPHQ